MLETVPALKPGPIAIRYRFALPNGSKREFELRLDGSSLTMIPHERSAYPDWTKLGYRQCKNCPLKENTHPRCPVAANLAEVVEFFKESLSYETADVQIETEARTYSKSVRLADGMSSLVGIFMVTSGCPILDKLKPMVRTHLPFATWEETFYRVISMYLMSQYLRMRKGLEPDWEMKGLLGIYEEIREVNRSFCERLQATCIQDAAVNAVVHLDCLADIASNSLQKQRLNDLEKVFGAYLDGKPKA